MTTLIKIATFSFLHYDDKQNPILYLTPLHSVVIQYTLHKSILDYFEVYFIINNLHLQLGFFGLFISITTDYPKVNAKKMET